MRPRNQVDGPKMKRALLGWFRPVFARNGDSRHRLRLSLPTASSLSRSCRATRQTGPLATIKTGPLRRRRGDVSDRRLSFPAMTAGEERMETPGDVAVMLRLAELGWGSKRIADELGCSRTTVKRYLRQGGWASSGSGSAVGACRVGGLAGRAVSPAPGQCRRGAPGVGARARGSVSVCARSSGRWLICAAICSPRRGRACASRRRPAGSCRSTSARRSSRSAKRWCGSICSWRRWATRAAVSWRRSATSARPLGSRAWRRAFRHFGGVPREVLLDNAKPLVVRHDAVTREVVFNERLHAFARYWGFRPRACAPYRARTKGKDENGVGYVKKNAIAGHRFASWAALEAHLVRWMREVADQRIHGTTGEPPIERFRREEAEALASLMGRPPFRRVREVVRRVQADGSVDLDTNHYSVPWRLIGARVRVEVAAGVMCIFHAGVEVARHDERRGRRERFSTPPTWSVSSPRPGCRWRHRRRSASCCGRWPSTSRSPEVGGECRTRPLARDAGAARPEGDARPARQPARRGRAARSLPARGTLPGVRGRGGAPRGTADQHGPGHRQIPVCQNARRLRVRRPAVARPEAGPRSGDLPVGGQR